MYPVCTGSIPSRGGTIQVGRASRSLRPGAGTETRPLYLGS